jgi:hypothetical protein
VVYTNSEPRGSVNSRAALIPFPPGPPAQKNPEADAFSDFETILRNLAIMGDIAFDSAFDVPGRSEELEHAQFTARKVLEMAQAANAEWHDAHAKIHEEVS